MDEKIRQFTLSSKNALFILMFLFSLVAKSQQETGDFMGIMNENLQQLKQAIDAKKPQEKPNQTHPQ